MMIFFFAYVTMPFLPPFDLDISVTVCLLQPITYEISSWLNCSCTSNRPSCSRPICIRNQASRQATGRLMSVSTMFCVCSSLRAVITASA